MSEERATAIQNALIAKGYLSGTPTGHWDDASIEATRKLQGDNGWQTKIVPDSRALIKLGLGPEPLSGKPDGCDSHNAAGSYAGESTFDGRVAAPSVAPPPVIPQSML